MSKSQTRLKAGSYSAVVPIRVILYTAEERARWRAMWQAWEASRRKDWSAWQEFEPLARSGRTIYVKHTKVTCSYTVLS